MRAATSMEVPQPPHFDQLETGAELPALERTTVFAHWNRYAAVNDEFIDVHMEREAAQAAGQPDVFGMGNLRIAYVHNALHRWLAGGGDIVEFGCQFRALNLKGDRLRTRAVVVGKEKRDGAPLATLEEALVPIYMYHRYQTEAAAKLVGGLNYTFAVRGDGQKATEMIPAAEQRRALEALLQTLQPEVLALPDQILKLIPPRPDGYSRGRETFNIRTGLTFDPLAAAETAASMTVKLILHPERVARLIAHHARDHNFPALSEVMDKLISATWKSSYRENYHTEIQRVVNNVVLYHLMSLAANEEAATQVRAIAWLKLDELKRWLDKQKKPNDEGRRAHYAFALAQINQFQMHPKEKHFTAPVEPPAGPPIGMEQEFCNFDFDER